MISLQILEVQIPLLPLTFHQPKPRQISSSNFLHSYGNFKINNIINLINSLKKVQWEINMPLKCNTLKQN